MSHNFLTPLFKIKKDATQLRNTKIIIIMISLVSYLLARQAEGIFDLLEMASSFGTAGILVITLFGLWTSWGNQLTALLTLLTGLVTTPIAQYMLQLESPFLFSIGCSFSVFVVFSALKRVNN